MSAIVARSGERVKKNVNHVSWLNNTYAHSIAFPLLLFSLSGVHFAVGGADEVCAAHGQWEGDRARLPGRHAGGVGCRMQLQVSSVQTGW